MAAGGFSSASHINLLHYKEVGNLVGEWNYQGVFIFPITSENVSFFLMDRDTMDAMDRMDTRTAGDVLEPVHSSIKRKVDHVHSVHPCPFVSLSMKMNENALVEL